MKTKLKKFGAWLMAMALAFAGAGAYGAGQTLTVDDDWAGKAAGEVVEGGTIGTTAFADIQSAINAAAAEDAVVSVRNGTYAGFVFDTVIPELAAGKKNLTVQAAEGQTAVNITSTIRIGYEESPVQRPWAFGTNLKGLNLICDGSAPAFMTQAGFNIVVDGCHFSNATTGTANYNPKATLVSTGAKAGGSGNILFKNGCTFANGYLDLLRANIRSGIGVRFDGATFTDVHANMQGGELYEYVGCAFSYKIIARWKDADFYLLRSNDLAVKVIGCTFDMSVADGVTNSNGATAPWAVFVPRQASGSKWSVSGSTVNIADSEGAEIIAVWNNGGTASTCATLADLTVTENGNGLSTAEIAKTKAMGAAVIVNPVVAAGSYTAGGFHGFTKAEVEELVADGCIVIDRGNGAYEIVVKTTDETVVTTKPQESKVAELSQGEKSEVFEGVPVEQVAEVVEKIQQSTKVEGVALTTVPAQEWAKSGVESVVAAAKAQDQTFAEAVAAAAEVSVKVEVEVKPTEYDNTTDKGKVAFKLTPKATVTVGEGEGKLEREVPVTNDMIDQNQKIAVSIYTGFAPAVITHDDDNGARIETFEGEQISFNEATGVATVFISHFSTVSAFGVAADVPAPKVFVAKVGDTPYETLKAAFDAVTGGETVTLLANCALDAATSIPNKDVTITAVDPSISLTLKTGGYGGDGANVTFKDMKLIGVAQSSSSQYTTGLIGVKKETYENCTMIGPFCTYGAASFTGCVFKSVDYVGDENNLSEMPKPSPYEKMQSLWVYVGNCLVTVDHCKFLTYDRAVKIFGDQPKTFNVRFTNTDFYCKVKNKSAIMVAVDHLEETNIIIDEKTVIAHPQYSDEVEGGYPLVYSEYSELNGGTSEKKYLEDHPEATVRGQYAVGENIVLDESGKITAGTFSKLVGEKIVAEGHAPVVDQDTGKIVVKTMVAAVVSAGGTETNGFSKLSAALTAAGEGEKVILLADTDEQNVPLTVEQEIILNGHAFTGTVAPVAGYEKVHSEDGKIYLAPAGIEVPVGGGKTVKVRGYTAFPEGVATLEEKQAYLAAKPEGTNLARWQTFVMGVEETTKLAPQIGAATEGSSTVVIKADDFPALNPPARCGMKTAFRLMQVIGTQTGYSQYGADGNNPSFEVDVKEIAAKTFWKIQASFKSTEVEDAAVAD